MSINRDTIRVALEDCGDAAEYKRIENGWISEYGEPVEVELQSALENETVRFPWTARPERQFAFSCVV